MKKQAMLLITSLILLLSISSALAITATTCSANKVVTYYTVPSVVQDSLCVVNKNPYPVNVTFGLSSNIDDIIQLSQVKVELAPDEKRFIPFDAVITQEWSFIGTVTYYFTVSPSVDNFPSASIPSTIEFRKGTLSCRNGTINVCRIGECSGLQSCNATTLKWGACVKNDPTCGIECETDADCGATSCDHLDGCHDGRRYYDCDGAANTCLADQTCTDNTCPAFESCSISGTDSDHDGWDSECGDCDDTRSSVNPGAQEIPGNGIDDDCNWGDTPLCTIVSPTSATYSRTYLPFTVVCEEQQSQIRYFINGGSLLTLCRNCIKYNSSRSFYEGQNTLTISATNMRNESQSRTVGFFIDSVLPRIIRAAPAGSYSGGIFNITYNEKNLVRVEFNYRTAGTELYETFAKEDCPSGAATCIFQPDLSDYDGQQIEYFFTLEDIAGRRVESPTYKVNIDLSIPTLKIATPFKQVYNRTSVPFNLSADEKVEFGYIDLSAAQPYYRRLISGYSTYNRSVSFADGFHRLIISVTDPARNVDSEEVSFYVDSAKPYILSTSPQSGLTNGKFSVTYTERFCGKIILKVWNNATSIVKEFPCVSASPVTSYYLPRLTQNMSLNLSSIEGQLVRYNMTIIDIANNSASKTISNLRVDVTAPRFNSTSTDLDGRYLYFNISLGERVKYLKYIDTTLPSPAEQTLCSGCTYYRGSKYFGVGSHTISLIAEDYAGNRNIINGIHFTVI